MTAQESHPQSPLPREPGGGMNTFPQLQAARRQKPKHHHNALRDGLLAFGSIGRGNRRTFSDHSVRAHQLCDVFDLLFHR